MVDYGFVGFNLVITALALWLLAFCVGEPISWLIFNVTVILFFVRFDIKAHGDGRLYNLFVLLCSSCLVCVSIVLHTPIQIQEIVNELPDFGQCTWYQMFFICINSCTTRHTESTTQIVFRNETNMDFCASANTFHFLESSYQETVPLDEFIYVSQFLFEVNFVFNTNPHPRNHLL